MVAILTRRRGQRRPGLLQVFAHNPEAGCARSGEETVLALPGREAALALKPLAARFWDLLDGRRSLLMIAIALSLAGC